MAERQQPREGPPSAEPREQTTKEQARELKEEAKSKARELKEEASERAERWTASMGRQTESLARALRAARDSLWTEGQERMASVVGQAADQVDRMSGYLEEENPSGMLDDLADLGRHNPSAFLGSAFAMGLATGRFLRASSPNGQEHAEADGGDLAGVGASAAAPARPMSGPGTTQPAGSVPAGARRRS